MFPTYARSPTRRWPSGQRSKAFAAFVIGLGAMTGLTACGGSGGDRSAAAYCDAFYSGAAPLHAKMTQAAASSSSDPLTGFATAISSIGDLESIFDRMDKHAPDEIESDTAQVRDSLKRLQENLGAGAQNPIGALASNVVTSLTSAGAFQRVGDYLQAHCPLGSAVARKYVGDVASTQTTTPTTTTPGAAPTGSDGLPDSSEAQLVVCAAGDFYAVGPDSSGSVSTPFAKGPTGQYTFGNSVGSCGINVQPSPSPDFSTFAATSDVSDGSTVAGFVDAGTDSFTDLSGHDSSSYSGGTVTDDNPMFSPTGDLWWTVETGYNYGDSSQVPTAIYRASPDGSSEKWGKGQGQLVSFTPAGDPSPYRVFPSPSGKLLALFEPSQDNQVLAGMAVASPDQVDGQCLEKAIRAGGLAKNCPGVAEVGSGNAPDCSFAGAISDSEVVCLAANGDSTYYESVPFTVSGSKLRFGAPTKITPPTVKSVANLGVSTDGQTLWYELNENGGGRTLYQVPTSTFTADPQSFDPQVDVDGQPTSVTKLSPEGWLWHKHYWPLVPTIF
jgi:hypothetical protein